MFGWAEVGQPKPKIIFAAPACFSRFWINRPEKYLLISYDFQLK